MAVLGSVLKPPKVLSPTRYGYVESDDTWAAHYWTASRRTAYTGGSGLTTVIEVTSGPGIIEFCGWGVVGASSSWGYDFYIDDVEVAGADGVNANSNFVCLCGTYSQAYGWSGSDITAASSYGLMPFNKSFKLDITSNMNAYAFDRYYTT